MGLPCLFFVHFRLFKQTLQFLQQINGKKCPSSIRCWDSNPRPSEHESPPITTRPGFPPLFNFLYFNIWRFSPSVLPTTLATCYFRVSFSISRVTTIETFSDTFTTYLPTYIWSHSHVLASHGPLIKGTNSSTAAACAWTSKLMDFKLGQGCFTAKLQIVGRQQFSAIKPFGKLLSSFFHFFVRL